MKLIVGLGNPGGKYESTRHNIGFMVVEKLARELSPNTISWQEDNVRNALVTRVGDVMLAKPLTYVNGSGLAVGAMLRYYKLTAGDVWVIHDDIDLPLGKIRIRESGGTGGHHGIESIVKELKTDAFIRFRLGIGKKKNVVDYVLSRFSRHEAGSLKHLVKRGAEAVRVALLSGLDRAMNRFN